MTQFVGLECRSVHYVTSLADADDDAVFIKEIQHLEGGGTRPYLRMIENYKVPYWITQKGYRNYIEQKESELISRCVRQESNYARLPMAITRSLGKPLSSRMYLKDVLDSPYVYGADTTPGVWIKHQYLKQYPDVTSEWKVAAWDIEFDVVNKGDKNNGIILSCITLKDLGVSWQFINTNYIANTPENIKKLDEAYQLYAAESMKDAGITEIKYVFCNCSAKVAAETFKRAHEIKPDIMSAWNHQYDLKKCIEALDDAGYDLGDVFSDPSVPSRYRKFRFVEGSRTRVTAAGKTMNLGYQELWHTVYAPSTFVFLDAMAAYYHIRKAEGQLSSYSLNDVLQKELGVTKMKFQVMDANDSLKWHQIMQKDHPFVYAVYNWYDCHRMNELEAKTNDLGISVPALLGFSEFEKFPKQPRLLADKFTFTCLEHGEVPGTTGRNMVGPLDQHLPSIKGWIVTLDTQNVDPGLGIHVFKNLPTLPSMVYIHVADLDCVSTYPTTEEVANMSRATTKFEVCRMKELPFNSFRLTTVNFSSGPVNALNIMQEICNFPTHDQMFDIYNGIKIDYQNAIIVKVPSAIPDPETEEGLVDEDDEAEPDIEEMEEDDDGDDDE